MPNIVLLFGPLWRFAAGEEAVLGAGSGEHQAEKVTFVKYMALTRKTAKAPVILQKRLKTALL
ncbi:MAG TPA: hypothetical protein VEY69_03605 [Lautropia sp.]|jgi:hypothetical protein|nr:hypothetical protein [Lautropia sp.]